MCSKSDCTQTHVYFICTLYNCAEWWAEKLASSMLLSVCECSKGVKYLKVCVFTRSHTRSHTSGLRMHDRNKTHKLFPYQSNINTHSLSYLQPWDWTCLLHIYRPQIVQLWVWIDANSVHTHTHSLLSSWLKVYISLFSPIKCLHHCSF